MPDQPDFAAALARIAELNRALGRDPAKDPILAACRAAALPPPRPALRDDVPEPIAAAARDLADAMRGTLSKISAARRRTREEIDQYVRIRDEAADDASKQAVQALIDRKGPGVESSIAALDGYAAAVRAKIERLERAPASMFLPIGTVVRFTAAPSHPNNLDGSREDSGREYPAPGSVGVVTRLNRDGEYPIGVSMRREFRTGYGDTFSPDDERIPTFRVDPEKVEVIATGLLPGGRPCQEYGFLATHARVDAEEGDEMEMIVAADGFFWRFCDFGGTQGVEALSANASMDEMPWIGAPLVRAVEPGEDQPGAGI